MARTKKTAAKKAAEKKKADNAAPAADLGPKNSEAIKVRAKEKLALEKAEKAEKKAAEKKPLSELTRNSAILESLNLFIYKRKIESK